MGHPASYWIEKLRMQSHVEGGSFSEVYRSPVILQPDGHAGSFPGSRNLSTHIYFLLQRGQISAFHRIRSDEIWHFYHGDPVEVFELEENGTLITHRLGPDPEQGQTFFCVVRAGNWFASAPAPDSEFGLCGCTVAPGFDFDDFEMAKRDELLRLYPAHAQLIRSMTRQ